MVPSSQVTSARLHSLRRMYGIITYTKTFEYYIKQTNKKGSLNINKDLIHYGVKDIWETKIETPGKSVLKYRDGKEQNKIQQSKKENK